MPNKPKDNIDLINYKLDALIETVEKGFSRLDANYIELNKRISILEIWQPRIEGDIDSLKKSVDNIGHETDNNIDGQLIKIIISVVAVLGTLATVLLQVLK